MPRLMIFGSCVSRDSKEFFPKGWKVGRYLARQSIISAANGPANLPGESKLTSPFQNRMVAEDIEGTGLDMLATELPEHDLLLIDLVDERHGVYEVEPGQYVTRTDELIRSTLLKQQTEPPRHIEFGTEKHFTLWSSAADKLHNVICKSEVPTVFVAPAWAEIDNLNETVLYKKRPVSEINQQYKRYNDYLAAKGIPVASVSSEDAVTDVNHRWGRSTFHFTEDVYNSLRDQILEYYNSSSN